MPKKPSPYRSALIQMSVRAVVCLLLLVVLQLCLEAYGQTFDPAIRANLIVGTVNGGHQEVFEYRLYKLAVSHVLPLTVLTCFLYVFSPLLWAAIKNNINQKESSQ